MLHNDQTEEAFTHTYDFRKGFMYPGDAPGLGVDIREDIAAKFPYQRAYLPVNRKEDGTLFHW
jgi:mannonate dehydratase